MIDQSAHSFDPATAEDGIELVFDDEPTPPPAPAKARRIRAARTTEDTAAEPPIAAEAARAHVAPETPSEAAATQPAVAPALPNRLLIAALVIALLSAVVAAVGLIVATRTITASRAAAHAAEAQTARLAQLPDTLARLDRLIAGEQAALAQLAQGRAGQPATVGDLQRELDRLRSAIAEHKPQQDMALLNVTKAGQAEMTERLGALQDAVDELKARGGAR